MQEVAFTLCSGIAYVQAALDAGLAVDDFAPRLAFFFNCHNNVFQEVAKFRAARRMWAQIMRERFGATDPRSLKLRFHTQTGGVTLTAQQPENNIARVALQAFAAVCGGTQSLHTNGFDEALALPSEKSAKTALRTQQIVAHESGATDTVDPFAGSYFVEALTDEIESRAYELIAKVDELGGAANAIEFITGEIDESRLGLPGALPRRPGPRRRRQHAGRGRPPRCPTSCASTRESEHDQLERLKAFKADRDQDARRAPPRGAARGRAAGPATCCPPIRHGAEGPLLDGRGLRRDGRRVRPLHADLLMAGPRRRRPISLRRFLPALALFVVGLVVLAVGGDAVTADAIALALIGVAAVLAVAVVFFEIGASEDRDRRAGRS